MAEMLLGVCFFCVVALVSPASFSFADKQKLNYDSF